MRNHHAIQQAGFGLLLEEGTAPQLPPLSHACRLAMRCWHWCRGWAPERWPLWGALNPVPDWDLHLVLLHALSDALDLADRTPPPDPPDQPTE